MGIISFKLILFKIEKKSLDQRYDIIIFINSLIEPFYNNMSFYEKILIIIKL